MAPRSTSSSITAAKNDHVMDFFGNLVGAMAQPGRRVISVLLVDRSLSMKGYETPVMDAVNDHLRDIKDPPDKSAQYAMVVTFNDGYRISVPLSPAATVNPMTSYVPKGNTLLYETIYLVLKLFTTAYRQLNTDQRRDLVIAMGIFTDGKDNQSPRAKYPAKLVQLVREARAMGFHFYTYGFRFDAVAIAEQMGMPTDDDHAKSFDKNPADFAAAGQHFSHSTTTFFGGEHFRPGSKTT